MAGVVFCSTNSVRAKELAEKFKFSVRKVECLYGGLENDIDQIVIPWDSCRKIEATLFSPDHTIDVSVYDDNFCCHLDDMENLKVIRESSMSSGDWQICKGINEVIIFSDVLHKRTKLNGFPTKLQIETTDICNARCIMCSHMYHNGSGIDLMENGLLEKISNLLPYLRVAVLHGNGEPFINKNLLILLDALKHYNIKFITNSNLSVIDDKLIPYLREDFIELNVSCDGHTKELYESIRVGLNYEKFCINVKKIRKSCPNLCMKMAVVVMRQNLPFLSDIVEFASKMGFDEVALNQLCVDQQNNNLEDAPYLYPNEYKEAIEKAKMTAQKSGITIRYPSIENKRSSNSFAIPKEREVIGICDWLVESPFVNLRGDVGICCINQMYCMGNIFESNFIDIWNGSPYMKIREQYYKGIIPKCCNGCDFLLQDNLKFICNSHADISKQMR